MDAELTRTIQKLSLSHLVAQFCIVALVAVAAQAQAGQIVSTSQGQATTGGVTNNVTSSPWPSGPSPDLPRPDAAWRAWSGGPSTFRSGPTPTWDHAPPASKQMNYKCMVKGQTTFQDTPCAGGYGVPANNAYRTAPTY